MARTNATKVKAIMPLTGLTDEEIEIFINTANLMVTENCTGTGQSDDLLIEVETYLSAHLIHMTKVRQAEKVKIGKAEDKYANLGVNLEATTFGQVAAMLDKTGGLAALGKKRARFEVATSFDDSPVHDL